MPDKYDKAIALLAQAPDFKKEVYQAWNEPSSHRAGCLFTVVTDDSAKTHFREDRLQCGCLTQIRQDRYKEINTVDGPWVALTDDLTERIRKDDRIPDDPKQIETVEQLQIFAEWQRIIDRELDRV